MFHQFDEAIAWQQVILKHTGGSNYMILGSNVYFRLISADGTLLKPSKPATPINKQIIQVHFCLHKHVSCIYSV